MADLHCSLSVADLKDIQAGPVYALFIRLVFLNLTSSVSLFRRVHVPTRNTIFLFFAIKEVDKFRNLLENVLPHITTSDCARRMQDEALQAKLTSKMATLAGINVSFSHKGLSKLLSNADTKDEAFKKGQFEGVRDRLGDDTEKWLPEFKDNPIDGLFEVTGYPATHIENVMQDKIKNPLGDNAITVIYEHVGKVRPGDQKGHEHCESIHYISYPP